MSNKRNRDLIRSLKPGDVVITGNHIGAIRYLGPLDKNLAKNECNKPNKNRIFELWAGIELTEPNGNMNGSMTIGNENITYFKTMYGDHIKRKKNRQRNEEIKQNDVDTNHGEYGILIPAVSIQRKINSFSLLKKITALFQQYKQIKQRLDLLERNESNEASFNDIKTNSDLISANPSSTTQHIQPQPRNVSETNSAYNSPLPIHNNMNQKNIKKSQTSHNIRFNLNHNNNTNYIHHHHAFTEDKRIIPLRKINSAPQPYRTGIAMEDEDEEELTWNVAHRHSHTVIHNITTPHITNDDNDADDDDINNSDFPSIEATSPPQDSNDNNKQQLITSLPAPIRKKRQRGYSYHHTIHNNYHLYDNDNDDGDHMKRQRGYSYHSYCSQRATARTPSPSITKNEHEIKNKNNLKISLAAPSKQTALSGPVTPSTIVTVVVNDIDDKSATDTVISSHSDDVSLPPPPQTAETQQTLLNIVKNEKDTLNKLPETMLSPQTSMHSDHTTTTLNTNTPKHHASASMTTYAPLNCWNDSNRNSKLTSSGGDADKLNDLSSLAIRVSSPRHITSASANFTSSRSSLYRQQNNDKMQIIGFRVNKHHHKQQDTEQLKQLLHDMKRENISKKQLQDTNDEEIEAMTILSDTVSPRNDDMDDMNDADDDDDDDDDHVPKLVDNNTTTATVHSPPVNVLENIMGSAPFPSPEEKIAEVENNDDEKQFIGAADHLSDVDVVTPVPNDVDNGNGDGHNNDNKKSRWSLTEYSLRKHNKRRASGEQFELNTSGMSHHHQQTLSEPTISKFTLMMIDHLITEDEKSASSDGEDRQSLGMDLHIDQHDHTNDIKDDDPQLIKRYKSTPTYSNYKTKHEYLRDMNYFNTIQRAQAIDKQFRKYRDNKIKQKPNPENMENMENIEKIENKGSLNIIEERQNDIETDTETEKEREKEKGHHHQTQLSCDTRAAVKGGIEPYQPPQDDDDILLVDYPSHITQSALV